MSLAVVPHALSMLASADAYRRLFGVRYRLIMFLTAKIPQCGAFSGCSATPMCWWDPRWA